MPLFLSCPYDSCTCKPDLFFNGSQWCGCLLSVLHSCFRLKPLSQLTIRSYFHGVVVDTRRFLSYSPLPFQLASCLHVPACCLDWRVVVYYSGHIWVTVFPLHFPLHVTYSGYKLNTFYLYYLLHAITNNIPRICLLIRILRDGSQWYCNGISKLYYFT